MLEKVRIPRKRNPSDRPDLDWLSRVAELLEFVCERCSPDTGYALGVDDATSCTEVQLADALTAEIADLNGFFHTSRSVRDANETIEQMTDDTLAGVLVHIKDQARDAANGRRRCNFAAHMVESARMAVPILRRHSKPTLRERVQQLEGGADPVDEPQRCITSNGERGDCAQHDQRFGCSNPSSRTSREVRSRDGDRCLENVRLYWASRSSTLSFLQLEGVISDAGTGEGLQQPSNAQTGARPTGERAGRLPKEDSKILRAVMLAKIREHPTLKEDIPALASAVGVSESTIRRWLDEEQQKFNELLKAKRDFQEE